MRSTLGYIKLLPNKNKAGFTLIEMAVVIVICGVGLASALSSYHTYQQSQIVQKMDDNASIVASAITNHLIQKGRYPCPAPLNVARDNPLYGIEGNCDKASATSPSNPTIPASFMDVGACANGICVEWGRDIVPPSNVVVVDLVDFGDSAANNTFGVPGWNTVIWDSYTNYQSVGPGGTGITLGNNEGYDFQGVTGTARPFAAGDQILVTWYNKTGSAKTITPKLSMTNPGRFWGDASAKNMSTVTVPAGGTAISQYTFTAGTAGTYSVVNINVNDASQDFICDKIVLSAGGASASQTFEAETMPIKTTGEAVTDGWRIWTNGYVEQTISFPTTGTYSFDIIARGRLALGVAPLMRLRIDGVSKGTLSVGSTAFTTYSYAGVSVTAGSHQVEVAFTNDHYAPPEDRDLFVDKLIVTSDTIPTPIATTTRVRRGAVPFRTLGIPEYVAEDAYRTRFQYAVTEELAVTATYDRARGAIDVRDGGLKSLSDPPASIHYLIIGSGPDKAGGYTREGRLISPCPTVGLDAENCNTGTAPNDRAIYNFAEYSEAPGATHFDDYMKFYSSVELPLWQISGAGSNHIKDMIGAGLGAPQGKVGIGVDPAGTSAVLQVAGEVFAGQDIHTGLLCPKGSNNTPECYAPNTDTDITCPLTGQPLEYKYVKEFIDGTVGCTDIQTGCRAGELMTGIDAAGNVICAEGAGCAADPDYQTCGVVNPLPARSAGSTYITPLVSGKTYQETLKCISGGWQTVSSIGRCEDCTSRDVIEYPSCSSQRGGFWNGNIEVRVVDNCMDDPTTTPTGTDTCACYNGSTLSVDSCPQGSTPFGGGPRTETPWTCGSSSSGSWGTPIQTGGCTCDPNATYTENTTCQALGFGLGYNGNPIKTYRRNCSTNPNRWDPISNTGSSSCVCSNFTEPVTLPCLGGLQGARKGYKNYNCALGDFEAPVITEELCGTASYTWTAITNPTSHNGSQAPYPRKGSSCNASEAGVEKPCYSQNSTYTYSTYAKCQCQ